LEVHNPFFNMEWNFMCNVWMFLYCSSVVLHVCVFIKYVHQPKSILE